MFQCVVLFALVAAATAEPEADPARLYGGIGYGRAIGGYGYGGIGYGRRLGGYGGGLYGRRIYGKRSADAEPEADPSLIGNYG